MSEEIYDVVIVGAGAAGCVVASYLRDFAAWQDAVGDTGKWSYEDLLPVFMAQERNDTFHDDYHGINGGLAVQLPKGINELNQYCLKAFQEYGLPYQSPKSFLEFQRIVSRFYFPLS
jgi:choline dehydrogenase-like flavoprotein